jgi:hypothetical protein
MRVGAGEQTIRMMAPESPALARMDRAISELGAHARLLSALREDRVSPHKRIRPDAMKTVHDIREIIAVIGKGEQGVQRAG